MYKPTYKLNKDTNRIYNLLCIINLFICTIKTFNILHNFNFILYKF